ncbi:hypothetical protein NC653_000573 [Populus alba x Populus x berolinensis]|uniref:Uncharacterized protein n=1 Tax=Populus alba x Populus x berolinensis TaxID=444605 RepID=A0AAD6RJL2_9ROSI|nr:hypothetical protein NC653_000573 [Populus alba x Populus x berolinensis]
MSSIDCKCKRSVGSLGRSLDGNTSGFYRCPARSLFPGRIVAKLRWVLLMLILQLRWLLALMFGQQTTTPRVLREQSTAGDKSVFHIQPRGSTTSLNPRKSAC